MACVVLRGEYQRWGPNVPRTCQVEFRGGPEVFEDEGARNGEDKV
jgi:hypothetical protein